MQRLSKLSKRSMGCSMKTGLMMIVIAMSMSACGITGGINYDRCKDIKVSGHLHPSCDNSVIKIRDGGVNLG